jgi:hypothetical protein
VSVQAVLSQIQKWEDTLRRALMSADKAKAEISRLKALLK